MGSRIKLAVFVDGDFIPSYDGASNRFHYLSRYLSKNGVDLVVFHGYRGWSDVSLIKKEPFKTYLFSIESYYNNLELISSILIREGINIIQFDNLEPILLQGVRLSQLTGARLVSEMHYVVRNLAKGLGASEERLFEIKNVENEVGKAVDHLICLSDQDKPYLMEYLNLNPHKISVVPSGVDCEEIQCRGSNIQARNIIFLGNLYFRPNEDAVRAIKEYMYPKLRNHGFKFMIGGDCPDEIKKELSDDRFTFTGTVPDLNDLFRDATFALAPISEGTGMRIKLLNYLAAGIPVITTSTAAKGFPQKDVLVIEDDFTKYPDIILNLFGNKEALQKLSNSGSTVIKEHYDWNEIAKQVIAVYENILDQDQIEKEPNKQVLKTNEPVWLQEAVAKKRFKQIENPDLPNEFSYCIIEKDTVRPYSLNRMVAIEGMAGAGKTTFINNYIKKANIEFLPELEIDDKETLLQDNLETSKYFLIAEKQKSLLIEQLSIKNKNIVVDRTFLTTLAYCYARSKRLGNNEYEQLQAFYEKNKHNITFPTKLILLDVDVNESLKRRKVYAHNPEYTNWFDRDFLSYMRDFYENEMKKFIKIDVFYLNTTNLSAAEIANKLKDVI